MTVNRPVPDEWAPLLRRSGFVDKRPGTRSGQPSMRALAEAAHTTTTTVAAMMYGDRETRSEVVERVVAALAAGVGLKDPARIRRSVNALMSRAGQGPFRAHDDAHLLDAQERAAVNELIRLLALPKRQAQPLAADEGEGDPPIGVDPE